MLELVSLNPICLPEHAQKLLKCTPIRAQTLKLYTNENQVTYSWDIILLIFKVGTIPIVRPWPLTRHGQKYRFKKTINRF